MTLYPTIANKRIKGKEKKSNSKIRDEWILCFPLRLLVSSLTFSEEIHKIWQLQW